MTEDNATTRADLLAAVERSPAAAAAHDRSAWVGLFRPDATIEDPVGSRPHRGTLHIGRFYDTFIGPRDITFHRDADLVVGATVVRDLELEVTMASTLTMRIPAYLRYDLESGGKIAALQAIWELPAMVALFARSGLGAVPAGLALSRGLLRNQGPSGAIGFLSGFRGVGRRGRHHLAELLEVACAGDEVAAKGRLGDHVPVTLGEHDRLSTTDLVARLAGGRPSKILASGNTVAARVDSAGGRTVVIAEMQSAPLTIGRLAPAVRISSIALYAEDQ
jgi:hypothetical protein